MPSLELGPDGLVDDGLGVAEDHRAERHRVVDELVAVDVPDVSALAPLEEDRGHAPTNWVGLFDIVWVPSGMTRSARSRAA